MLRLVSGKYALMYTIPFDGMEWKITSDSPELISSVFIFSGKGSRDPRGRA